MRRPVSISLAIGFLIMLLGTLAIPQPTRAQVPETRPTATTIPRGNNDDNDIIPIMPGVIEGYVYDYSNGSVPQGGITVILDGGGWRAEMVTDSNGYYRFAGLGAGPAVLNLRLPPGARPVMPDWPVYTTNPADQHTNLGFYWGETPPIPVILSLTPDTIITPLDQTFRFQIQVTNQSGGPATAGLVEVSLPTELDATDATTNRGTIDFARHRIGLQLAELMDGETATLTVVARIDQLTTATGLIVPVSFSYNEQITAQRLTLAVRPAQAGAMVAARQSTSAAETEQGGPAAISPTLAAAANAETGMTAEAAATPTAALPAIQQETAPEMITADGQTIDSDTNGSDATAGSRIPATGGDTGQPKPSWPVFVLSIILLLALVIAGVKGFRNEN